MAAKFLSVYAILLSFVLIIAEAKPTPGAAKSPVRENAVVSQSSSLAPQSNINIIETTTTSSGDVLDWIPFDSQGDVADPPPFTPSAAPASKQPNTLVAVSSGAQLEPATRSLNSSTALKRRASVAKSSGTYFGNYDNKDDNASSGKKLGIVPVPRHKTGFQPVKRAPQNTTEIQKAALKSTTTSVPTKKSSIFSRALNILARQATSYAGQHWYVTSNYGAVTKGAKAIFSCFKPFTRPEDFSLLQMAVGRTGLASGLQTVEAGYQYYPGFKNTPRIFTFFNTNGYSAQGDNIGGYDQTVKGWVQSSSNYYPGIAVNNYSTFGGTQQELTLQYLLYNGNWWLYIQNEWAGYYPGSLFSANQNDASQTLAANGDQVFFYGEIAQGGNPLTTTDMGSGKSATTGFRQSAYIRNMQYASSSGAYSAYPVSSVDFYDSDSTRYNHSYAAPGASNWASYVYLGGFGAGGVTGA